jgi:hypothetical protein
MLSVVILSVNVDSHDADFNFDDFLGLKTCSCQALSLFTIVLSLITLINIEEENIAQAIY